MDREEISAIVSRGGEFGATAEKLHNAMLRRIVLLDEAVSIIGRCDAICENLYREIERSSDGETEQRDMFSVILNTCLILASNLKAQDEIVSRLGGENLLDAGTAEKISGIIEAASVSVKEALGQLRRIIELSNRIILTSGLIQQRKFRQGKSVRSLAGLIESCRPDLVQAAAVSGENMARAGGLAERLAEIGQIVDRGDRDAIGLLRDEARAAWQAEYLIGSLAATQFDLAEKVYHLTTGIHGELAAIRNMVEEKRRLFDESVQELTVLTVVIAMKFREYLGIKELVRPGDGNTGERSPLSELLPYADIACADITDLASLNLDMTGSSRRMNEAGTRILAATNEEMHFCGEIWDRVEEMTNQARYSVEGAEMNIRNGRFLEQELERI